MKAGGFDNAGTAFELTRDGVGWDFHTLYSFTGTNPNDGPWGSLAVDSAGNLYGIRGTSIPTPVVFKLTHADGGWTSSVLHASTIADGQYIPGTLSVDASGNVYGTAIAGGAHGHGTVWEITP
ncbi:MAG TPA: choice-of-anchor tandem repeat GloVer-containing protein [Candidatus Binatia bacterium]|nr:choice-of-anchor tandem repeat GloVer-containing protein [Candidatus Binatia bacterium]